MFWFGGEACGFREKAESDRFCSDTEIGYHNLEKYAYNCFAPSYTGIDGIPGEE
jgi:hypothetical protein